MSRKEIEVFDTTDEAVTYLYNNPGFSGDIRVFENDDDPVVDCSEVDNITTHNPDLPIQKGDLTHRSLWLLAQHEADSPERTLSPGAVLGLSTAEKFDVNKALNSLVKGGYANKRKAGIKPFFYITEKGERRLDHFEEPVEEVTGEPVHIDSDTTETPFQG